MKEGLHVTGWDQLQRTLSRFSSPSELQSVVRPEMNRVGAKILRRSVELTPRDRGGLAASAGMEVRSVGGGLEVAIGYSAPYTRKVHDNPRAGKTGGVSPSGKRYRHWAAVGEYKFLETAMREAEHTAWPDVARGIESWLRRHGR